MRWLIALGLVYLGFVGIVWLLQGRMIHFPTRELVTTPADIGLSYEEVSLTTADKEELQGWFLPAANARATLLFFHGNAGNISHRLESLQIFNKLRLSVLIIDYRGYGSSSGSPSEQGLYSDAQAAYRYLVEARGVEPERLVIFGRSLGGAVAAKLAADNPAGALILESSFTSVPDLGAQLYPFLPVRLLSRYQYDTRAYVQNVEAPVLIVHSRDDETIPYEHGRALYQAAPEPRRLLDLQGSHNRGFIESRKVYLAGLEDFLEEFLN